MKWRRVLLLSTVITLAVACAVVLPVLRQASKERQRAATASAGHHIPCEAYRDILSDMVRSDLPENPAVVITITPTFSAPSVLSIVGDDLYLASFNKILPEPEAGVGGVAPPVRVELDHVYRARLSAGTGRKLQTLLDQDVPHPNPPYVEAPDVMQIDGTYYWYRTSSDLCGISGTSGANTRAGMLAEIYALLLERAKQGHAPGGAATESRIISLVDALTVK